MDLQFSSRLIHQTGPNALSALLDRKRSAGTPILDLTESNPTRAGIVYPGNLLAGLSDSASLLYEPQPFGLPSARAVIAARCGVPPCGQR